MNENQYDPKNEKKKLRAQCRTLRDNLTQQGQCAASEKICRELRTFFEKQKSRHVYAYYPLGSEPDLLPLIRQLLDLDFEAAFPRVITPECSAVGNKIRQESAGMVFAQIRNLSEDFEEGSFHIMEPVIRTEGQIVDWPDAIVLVPGLAFDRTGSRLGYGGGYYDRYFSQHSSAALMGICYPEVFFERLPVEEHDLKMDHVWTGESC